MFAIIAHIHTLFDGLVPPLSPLFQTFGVMFFDICALLYEGDEVITQTVAVVLTFGGAFVRVDLPETVAGGLDQLVIDRHGAVSLMQGPAQVNTSPPVIKQCQDH